MAMAIPKELQTLAQVAAEIDESDIKLTFANQCIKAQEALANKLKEEIQRRKETCNYKKNENNKLEAEIKNAELEIQNLRITYKSVKATSTEMKKELLLSQEKKAGITHRITTNEKKYEDIWIKCKERYENMPLVKMLMQSKNKCEELKNAINILNNEAQNIENEIKIKVVRLAEHDKKQIVRLAEYIVREMPATVNAIKDKMAKINNLNKEIDMLKKDIESKDAKAIASVNLKQKELNDAKNVKDSWSIDNTLMIPKLQLPSADMDICVKLDINKVTLHASPVKRTISLTELEKNTTKKSKSDEILKDNYISCYFNNNATTDDVANNSNSLPNYSQKKLINILEDIKIDDGETFKLLANVNIDQFQEVDVITTATKKAQQYSDRTKSLEIEEVEEVDITSHSQDKILNPPSQFLDLTQERCNEGISQTVQADVHMEAEEETSPKSEGSQTKEAPKKKVTFELSTTSPEDVNLEDTAKEAETLNETAASQLDLSDVNDDNYMAIKDMILKKKHQLDLSPQFVYAKNLMHKKNEENVTTSKFFETNQPSPEDNKSAEGKKGGDEKEQDAEQMQEIERKQSPEKENLVSMDVDNAVSSPENPNANKPVTGLLFTHGTQGITDLDISMSTNGYEDGDSDFPTCLDGSLLLSPKADLPPISGNSEAGSQDLPSFLTGFRKAGLSFFKQNPQDTNPEPSKQNQENNFNFNFGSDDRKSRGGLFSFFR